MYVPPFVCGIFFTIIAEIIVIIIASVIYGKRRERKNETKIK